METVAWAVCLLLGVPAALFTLFNWLSFVGYVIACLRGYSGSHSFAPPFLCGIMGAVTCLVCPLPGAWHWAWVPLLIDPSIGLLLPAAVLHVVARVVGWSSPFDREPSQPPS